MLYPYGGIAVFQDFFGIDFSIVHATNRGAAWGILSSYQYVLLVGRITLILAALVWMVFYNKNRNYSLPLALIITGAIANVVDTFFYGHVIDMLKFTFWGYEYPVFNVADSAIFVGVFWMIFATKQVEVKDKHAS